MDKIDELMDGIGMDKIALIDYGAGNMASITKALTHVGGKWMVVGASGKPEGAGALESFDKLVIPGVGAFIDGMKNLESRRLVEPIIRFAKSGKPLLGICLGFQILADEGTEFGYYKGLGIIPGRVLPLNDYTNVNTSIPHIGWTAVRRAAEDWNGTLLSGLEDGFEAYFIHSYFVKLGNEAGMLAETRYGGFGFASVVRSGNVFGTQFHPEKSGEKGLELLKNFVEM